MTDKDTALHLYRTHRVALTKYARTIAADSVHAEDVVQEAWLKLHYAPEAALIRDPLSYLYRIVRNLAVDTRRRLSREVARSEGTADEMAATLADARPSPEQAATARDELNAVFEALAELPERTQIAIRMNRIEGLKLCDVAKHLNISPGRAHTLIAEGIAYCDQRRTRHSRYRP